MFLEKLCLYLPLKILAPVSGCGKMDYLFGGSKSKDGPGDQV